MSHIEDFFAAEDAVAARILPGWFLSRRVRVPPGTFGYLLRSGRLEGDVVDPGTEVSVGDHAEVWVLRDGEWGLRLELEGLELAGGLPTDVLLGVRVRIEKSRSAARQFLAGRSWPDRVRAPNVAERMIPGLHETLGRHLEGTDLDSVASMDAAAVRDFLREAGEEVFFERGMTVLGVTHCDVRGVELDGLKQRETALQLEEKRVRQRLRFLDLWKRNEMGAELARRDVEAMQRYLRQQGVLKELDHDKEVAKIRRGEEHAAREAEQELRHLLAKRELEHRIEIDARRLEEEVEQTRRMNEVLREGGIEAQLFHLRDEALKGRLYRLLLERDMSPEQIRARSAGLTAEDLGELGDSIRELIASVRGLVELQPAAVADTREGGVREPSAPESPSASRVLIATESLVQVVSPGSVSDPVLPATLIALGGGGLGPLRSVRVARSPDGAVLVAGARGGLYVVPARDQDAGTPEAYRFREGSAALRGGTNSAVLAGDSVFATHSEVGLVRWAQGEKEAPEVLDPAGGAASTVRGVQCGPRGLLWYARGADLLAVDPLAPRIPVHHLTGAGEEISGFAWSGDHLFAGTAGGRLLHWDRALLRGPRVVASPGQGPVYTVYPIRMGDEDCCLVGARSARVDLYDAAGACRASFPSSSRVSWVAACARHVYAIDDRFHVLSVWERTTPDSPAREVTFPDKVRDIRVDSVVGGPERET